MATIGPPEIRLSAAAQAQGVMTREMRLSPRCLLTPSTSTTSSGLSSPASRRFSSSSSNNHSRQSSTDHNMSALSSSFEFTRGPPPPPPPSRHGRQGSVHSSTSAEISQYMMPQPPSLHSRQSSLDSSSKQHQSQVSHHQPYLHARQSSLDQSSGHSLRQKLGAQISRGCSNTSTKGKNSSTPPNYRLPPQFTVLGSKVSPTSLDMGYHTMVNGHGDDEESPSNSRTSIVGGCRPKEKSSVCLDTQNMIASYKGSKNVNNNNNNDDKIKNVQSNNKMSKRNIGNVPFFDTLSDDIVVKIFSRLSAESLCACARVCRRFYFLAWEPTLWRRIQFDGGENLDVDFAVESILKLLARDTGGSEVCSVVERFSLNNCFRLTDAGLSVISRRCPELRKIELKNCREVTNAGVQAIVTRCTSLSTFDLSGCQLVSTINCESCEPSPATAALGGVPPAPSRTLYLQHLDLSDVTRLMDAGLRLIAKNSPHLQHLYLRRCVNVTDIGIKYLASHCLSLRELSISDCTQITDRGLCELGKLGPNLRYLSVAKCEQITDAGVRHIARLCYKLRYLNVRGCETVSDSAIEFVAQNCTRLRSLDIGKCDITDQGLKTLAELCSSLKKLSVKSCEMVTDQGIQYIAYHCRGLQQLNIQDCPITLGGYRTIKKFCKRCIIEHTNPGFF